jgi:hypothetical protein
MIRGLKEHNLEYKQNRPVVAPSKRDIKRRADKMDRKMKSTSILSLIKSL